MKKLLFIFALFLTISMNAQEKVTLEKALVHVGVSNDDAAKVNAIAIEKKAAIKEIKKSGASKEEQKTKKKAVIKKSNKEIADLIGKDKYKEAVAYVKANKKKKK